MTDSLVWITGASSGIGAALAEHVPLTDAHVIDVSRSGGGPAPEHLPADLSDPSAWAGIEAHLVTQLGEFGGSTAVFIHNASTLDPMGFAGEVGSAAYYRNALLNAAAPQALGHAFLRACRGFEGRAHLIMLSSGAASSPYEGWSGYCAGKAALEMWVRCAGAEQQRRGGRCRVIAVAPGVVATGMQEQIRATEESDFPMVGKFHDLHDQGQLKDPVDAARGIWSLLEHDLENGAVVDLRTFEG